MMYGMIYDGQNEGLVGVEVYVNDKLRAQSDVQGRFILQSSSWEKSFNIRLEKAGYEGQETKMHYDSMGLLHFRLYSGLDLLKAAEERLDSGDIEGAKEYTRRSRESGLDDDRLIFFEAIVLYSEKRYAEAMEKLEEIDGFYAEKGYFASKIKEDQAK